MSDNQPARYTDIATLVRDLGGRYDIPLTQYGILDEFLEKYEDKDRGWWLRNNDSLSIERRDIIDDFFANQIQVCELDMEYCTPNKNETLLMILARKGLARSVKAALEKGADIHKKDNEANTALHVAAKRGHADVVRELLLAGADIEANDKLQNKPLTLAAINGHAAAVQTLLAHGANIEAYNDVGRRALTSAAYKGRTDCVHMLLGTGADIEARDNTGRTALIMSAVHKAGKETIPLLLSAGADIQAQDHEGFTSLCHAIVQGNSENIQILLDAGASVEERSENNKTMLEYIQESMSMDASVRQSFCNGFNAWRSAYANLVTDGTPPKTSSDLYHLMSVMSLADSKSPVDYVGNMRKICAHANWQSKEQLAEILDDIHNDGRIDGVTADAIVHENFPLKRNHVQSLVQARHTNTIEQRL